MKSNLKKSIQLSNFLLGTCLFLSGCASWTGLMPEKYDGNVIEKNEAAIAGYNDHKEIIGAEKELYILEPFSEDLLRPSLPLVEKEFVSIDAGEYTVGENFSEGRYQFHYTSGLIEPYLMNNATLRVTDKNGLLIVEELLTPFTASYLEVDLYDGNRVTLRGENFSVEMGASTNVIADEETDIVLTNGVWEVGKHLNAGTYVVSESPLSGYLYLFDETTEPRVFELGGTIEVNEETGEITAGKSDKELTFEENQKIYLKDLDQPIKLVFEKTE
ncbi:hypothetical protein JTF06_13845 [Desemzia sp. RIT804]|uniref:hypothetical protein n=1 Tax=Desemzia sp. RIT 804 TaxID=2810209 RepID=UPI001951D142|nr:hypothetical protein [Desemzia sp. RIT 804]MBM6615970.1 hypothetical protein [Desemzia sp. RIT 804]